MMKIVFLSFLAVSLLASCGYSARDVEAIGQVKRVVHNTPLICGDFIDVDISLGVMRGGVGSMSTQDILVNVNKEQEATLKKANESGALVKVTYDRQRFAICTGGRWATSVEVLK